MSDKKIKVTCTGADVLPVDALENFQGSLKKITKANLQKLKRRIIRDGINVPLFVWRDHDMCRILDGHQRLKALLSLREEGYELPLVPVAYIEAENEKDARQKLLGITSQYGEFEIEELSEWLAELDSDIADTVRIVSSEIKIKLDIETNNDDDIDDNTEQITKYGDLWELGRHRLLCGDSTKIDDVERLMDGKKADMIFTDPPYGLGKEILNDNLKREDWLLFYEKFTTNMLSFLKTNGYFYVWGYFDLLSNYWENVIKKRNDCNFRNFIIWVKNYIQGINSEEFRQFPESYEACLLCIYGQPFQNGQWSVSPNAEYFPECFEHFRAYLDGERKKMGWDIATVKKIVGHSDLAGDHWFSKSQWSMPTREVYNKLQNAARKNAFRKEYDELRKEYDELRKEYDELRGYHDNKNGWTDVWQFEKLTTYNKHPTVKPIEVCERGIITNSRGNEICLDLFLGSGSTLIACEKTSRICYGMELDEHYCDVIVKRYYDWMVANNKEPVIKLNGKNYEPC